MNRPPLPALFACLAACCGLPHLGRAQAPPAEVPRELADYVTKPDASTKWSVVNRADAPAGTVVVLSLTSQTWHGEDWTHDLLIAAPAGTKPQATMLIWNQGGKADTASRVFALQMATRVGAPVAMLLGVPKQPLLGGLREDGLIAETFTRYLADGDATWPLLFPMAKSITRAMDATQAFCKQEYGADVTGFVVSGASKRGWASWLVAASGDARVKGIAPMVIDTLNFPQQMKNQVAAFGKPSEMIRDYTRRGLVPIPEGSRAESLWRMVDPYSYRSRLAVPKLIVNGTNDPYWPLDALNSYYDDLPGVKALTYVPNAGHDLRERDAEGRPQLVPERAVNALAAFTRAVAGGGEFPAVSLKRTPTGAGVELEPRATGRPNAAVLWTATSATRDFREARWTRSDSATGGHCEVAADGSRFRAAFVEFEFGPPNQAPFTLATPVTVLPPKPGN